MCECKCGTCEVTLQCHVKAELIRIVEFLCSDSKTLLLVNSSKNYKLVVHKDKIRKECGGECDE